MELAIHCQPSALPFLRLNFLKTVLPEMCPSSLTFYECGPKPDQRVFQLRCRGLPLLR